MQTILPSANLEWGFTGTIRHDADPEHAWPLAMRAVANATGCPDIAVRDFLDGVQGRHFADTVSNGIYHGLSLTAAIDAAVAQWMDWEIDRRTERDLGIPRGLPYLTGFVTHYEILGYAE